MQFDLILYAPDENAANAAAKAAYDRIAALDRCLSDYNPESELSQLSQTAGSGRAVAVSDDLWHVLKAAQDLAEQTDGAFDVTVGPAVKLWRRARRSGEMPSPERLAEARLAMGYRHLELIPKGRMARLNRPGMRLDLGGIAVGYALDEALLVLRGLGVTQVLLDGSGDILAGDPPPGTTGWTVAVAPRQADGPPTQTLRLANAAVTTSGDLWQHVVIDGQRYSHIVDPATGLGLTDQSSVTVVAADGISADSLATAVSVLGPERGLELIAARQAAALVVSLQDGQEVECRSPRWEEFLVE